MSGPVLVLAEAIAAREGGKVVQVFDRPVHSDDPDQSTMETGHAQVALGYGTITIERMASNVRVTATGPHYGRLARLTTVHPQNVDELMRRLDATGWRQRAKDLQLQIKEVQDRAASIRSPFADQLMAVGLTVETEWWPAGGRDTVHFDDHPHGNMLTIQAAMNGSDETTVQIQTHGILTPEVVAQIALIINQAAQRKASK